MALLSVLLNGDNVSAKKLLIWGKIDGVRAGYFFKIMVVSFYFVHYHQSWSYRRDMKSWVESMSWWVESKSWLVHQLENRDLGDEK